MHQVELTETARERIGRERDATGKAALCLRVAVEGGGCAGFQYKLSWDDAPGAEDQVVEGALIVDAVSLPLLAGSRVDFVTSLMGSEFRVINPNAASSCGCGHSFSL